jgi:hypothetical protein
MWTDECFSEIQKGDKVWYCGVNDDNILTGPAKAIMIGPMGWVCDKGDGQPIVVNEGLNYLGHTEGKDRQPDHFGHFMNSHQD